LKSLMSSSMLPLVIEHSLVIITACPCCERWLWEI
jgi:hypothetical protein